MKYQNFIILISAFTILLGCNTNNNTHPTYLADIGDTVFNSNLDNLNFKFCDTSNVLHKRAYATYSGGIRNLEEDILNQYLINDKYKSFSGYFIVRFAINCHDETGRFRWEIVGPDFKETTCPKELESHIIAILKGLKKWNHPVYRSKDYDGYTYTIVKIENGNIIRS